MTKSLLILALCAGLLGCVTPSPLISTDVSDMPTLRCGPTNSGGSTQVAGIDNHGTIEIYLNANKPDDKKHTDTMPKENKQILADDPWIFVKERIKKAEGLSLKPYLLDEKLHIGYGLNLSGRGLTKIEADELFERFLFPEALRDVQIIFPDWKNILKPIQEVLIEMRYSMGPNVFREFNQMIDAVNSRDYTRMAFEMRKSKWWQKEMTHSRAEFLAQLVENINQL